MHRHRLALGADHYRIPNPPAPPPAAAHFCALPVAGPAGLLQIYAAAFALAQAVVRPSLPERDLLGVWN
jgi:hypothetical protein